MTISLRYHPLMSKRDAVALASLSLGDILTRRKALRRRLATRECLHPVRIALLGGSTTQELVDLLELWLLDSGFKPIFYQSEFGRFYDDAVHDSDALVEFRPDIVYIHTSVFNIQRFAPVHATEAEFEQSVRTELSRFQEIWSSLQEKIGCITIQNNFELPPQAIMGNLDGIVAGGRTRFVNQLNQHFANVAAVTSRLLIQDVCSISARIGLNRWFDARRWFSYKLPTSAEACNALAVSLAAMIRAIYGRARKALVLDLDNTLWGGVIGDDGVERIQIGRETPVAEAYTAFQEYCLSLRDRGVLLAVCSKNDDAIARQGFEHPDSVLKLEHLSCFKASWNPKPENLLAIAAELNLCVDSLVFIDDNPAERAIVAAQFPGVGVPDIGSDVAAYASIIEASRYFEQVSFTDEDRDRAALYRGNIQRAESKSSFFDYGDYLDSLEMTAEIELFQPLYLDRIVQLTNKTNQFNLTTRRYTIAEMESVLKDRNAIGLFGKLSDRFGDNGIVSIILGRMVGEFFDIDLWLTSCRVLKRDMESAMLDELAERAHAAGARTLRGFYRPTRKNAIVADHYLKMGFEQVSVQLDGSIFYTLDLAEYEPRNRHIRVLGLVLAGA